MVADDNICVSFSCLTVKKIGFYYITCMYWKAIVLKLINEFPQKDGVCGLNFLLKKLRETGTTDWQLGSGTHRCWEHWCSQ